MQMTSFKSAAEEIHDICLFHAALFIVGLAFTLAPQRSLKPTGPCADLLYAHYKLIVYRTVFFVFATFGAAVIMISGHVKRRVPDAGLQDVAATTTRALLRVHAALGCLLSAAATVLSMVAFIFLIQAKTGAWHCLPAAVCYSVVATYVVIACLMVMVYYHIVWQIAVAN